MRARVDESAKDDAFENREASRNELDEKDYTAWKEEDPSNDAIRPRGLGRV